LDWITQRSPLPMTPQPRGNIPARRGGLWPQMPELETAVPERRASSCPFSPCRNESRGPQKRPSALHLQSDSLSPRCLFQVAIECGQLHPVPLGQLQVSGVIHRKPMRPGQAQHFALFRRAVQPYR
jgi:hypothetical protein